MRSLRRLVSLPAAVLALTVILHSAGGLAPVTVPTDEQMPGTQPNELTVPLETVTTCSFCHAGYDPAVEPAATWRGSMMAQAARDPVFWAALAISEQDFAGAGDLCLRCHTPRGWLEGRSSPSDGSALVPSDADGVECILCHRMANPDGQEHSGVQNPPFIANDGGAPPVGYYGSGMFVIHDTQARLGPYLNVSAPHATNQSRFHRSADLCSTCHDVSNPIVGDLAHNNGAQVPLLPGTFNGTPNGPLTQKAAFNNFPYQYGVVERTSSEHKASNWATTPVNSYASLPPELKAGAVQNAWGAALSAGQGGNFEDGTTRYFSCQSCHMAPKPGQGCIFGGVPVRGDLAVHDLTGGNYWVPEAIQYMDTQGTLVLGDGLTPDQVAQLNVGASRSRNNLESAAGLSVTGDQLRIVNLTGHKLITGYPEGRRMWLHVTWYDTQGVVIREDGAYGPISVNVGGVPMQVESILNLQDPNLRTYEAHYGITQEWATQLISPTLGVSPGLVVEYDRITGAALKTLGQIATQAPGTAHTTLHFALNNTVVKDTRIPPWGMTYDAAQARNCLPVPDTQFGNPGPGNTFNHWDDVPLNPPAGAFTAGIELLYQPTSWEYIQFLKLANAGTGFLGSTGDDLLQAWQATGRAAPHVMAATTWSACGTAASRVNYGIGWPGSSGVPGLNLSSDPSYGTLTSLDVGNSSGQASWVIYGFGTTQINVPTPFGGSLLVLPDWTLEMPLPAGGASLWFNVPPVPALCGLTVQAQAVVVDPGASAGLAFTPGLAITFGN